MNGYVRGWSSGPSVPPYNPGNEHENNVRVTCRSEVMMPRKVNQKNLLSCPSLTLPSLAIPQVSMV